MQLSPTNIGLGPRKGGSALSTIGAGGVTLAPSTQIATQQAITAEELIASTELNPLVSIFFGRRGDGKTLCMTAILNIMKRAYLHKGWDISQRFGDGFKLATNYHVQFSDINDPFLIERFNETDTELEHALLGFDEILSFIPSRRTMARSNLDFAQGIVQIRKGEQEIVSATQKPQNIDSQMLDQIDLFIMPLLFNYQWVPQKELWTHKNTGKMWYKPTAVRLLIWDWWGTFTGKMYSKRWPPYLSGEWPDYFLNLYGIHELFSWFSTKERVPAIWQHNRFDILAEQGWTAEDAEAEDAIGDMANQIDSEAEGIRKDAPPPATIQEWVNAQADVVSIEKVIDEAKMFRPNVSNAQLADLFEEAGYTIYKRGKYGYLAEKQ